MAQRLKLILGTALSLPLAISKQEKKEALEQALKPLIKALVDFKHIKSTLSISGHLLDWCIKYRREYAQAIRELIGEKRIELLSGGYYDPIFPLIPRADSLDQIEYTSTAISKFYRKRPRGIWVNQLLWESSLTTVLTKCMMTYTFLRDTDCIDYRDEQQYMTTPVITEHAGKSIIVFPIATRLCKLWREHKFRALIRELRTIYETERTNDLNIITLADDSEEQRSANFIQRFFQILANNTDWIQVIHPANIPTNDYAMHTSYFYSQRLHKLKRNVGQDSEAGHLYATMHHNHELISQLKSDKQKKRLAKELVFQGQNYYSFIDQHECRYSTQAQRQHAYSAFIETTQMFYKEKQKRPTIVNTDYDFDGVTECLFNNDKMHIVVHRKGGVLTELSTVAGKWNWLDLSATEGSSDYTLPNSESEAKKPLIRNCSIDYLIPGKSSIHTFLNTKIHNYSLANQLFELQKIDHEQSTICLQTTTKINNGHEPINLNLKKHIQFHNNTVTISYQLQNKLDVACKAIFATQINLNPSLLHFDQLSLDYVDIATKLYPISSKKHFSVCEKLTQFIFALQNRSTHLHVIALVLIPCFSIAYVNKKQL